MMKYTNNYLNNNKTLNINSLFFFTFSFSFLFSNLFFLFSFFLFFMFLKKTKGLGGIMLDGWYHHLMSECVYVCIKLNHQIQVLLNMENVFHYIKQDYLYIRDWLFHRRNRIFVDP